MPLSRPQGLRAGFHASLDDPVSGLVHAGEQWAPAQFLIESHTHPVWELYVQMHGITRWMADGRTYLLHPGHLLVVAPGVEHNLAGPLHGGSHHFYFAAVDVDVVLGRQAAIRDVWGRADRVIHRTDAGEVVDAFVQLVTEVTIRHEYAAAGLVLAVDRLMVMASRQLSPSAAPELAVHPAVRSVKMLLDRQYQERWTLERLASRVGLAPAYLAGLFASQFGQPPHQYLNERRIDRARQLLSSSDLTITAIGLSLGFSSSQHFARVFRQLTGSTPTQYRFSNHR